MTEQFCAVYRVIPTLVFEHPFAEENRDVAMTAAIGGPMKDEVRSEIIEALGALEGVLVEKGVEVVVEYIELFQDYGH